MGKRQRPSIGLIFYYTALLVLGGYFTYAAVQGPHGVLKRAEVEAQARQLTAERDALVAEIERMENLTKRLSDAYLDLDLLDERARTVLGMIRADEILLR